MNISISKKAFTALTVVSPPCKWDILGCEKADIGEAGGQTEPEGGGTGLHQLVWLLNSLLTSLVLQWAAQICTSNFTGADRNNLIEMATAQHRIRTNKSPCSDLC